MSKVKWIKLNTDMFDDEKVTLIESMPEGDTILVIWIKLLNQAGKTNASGYIFLNEKIPYTEEMLSTLFRKPLNVVRLALQTFEQFGMIEIDGSSFIRVANWEKHQNIEGLEKIKEQTRIRVAKHREQKRLESNVTSNATETQGNETDIELELDKEIDKDINKYIGEIVSYLNNKASTKYRQSSSKTRTLINARMKEGFNIDDFKKVIDNKCTSWLNTDMDKFLRPETLFGTKFESYLNEKPKRTGVARVGTNEDARKFKEDNNLPF